MKALSSGSTRAARSRSAAAPTDAPRSSIPRQSVTPPLGPVGEHDHVAEAGEARVRPRSQRRHDLADHGEVVDRPGAVGEEHRGGVRLAEDVGHVLGAEAGVDRHEHRADLHDGEHRVDPLGTVDHPERDLVPRRDAEGQEPLWPPRRRARASRRTSSVAPGRRGPPADPTGGPPARAGVRSSASRTSRP